jgi:hypothetical protein
MLDNHADGDVRTLIARRGKLFAEAPPSERKAFDQIISMPARDISEFSGMKAFAWGLKSFLIKRMLCCLMRTCPTVCMRF